MTVAGDGPDQPPAGEAWPVIDVSPTGELAPVPAHRGAWYRGSRRRSRGYPVGAIFVAALILLVTVVVAVQALTGVDRRKPTGGQPFPGPVGGPPTVGVFSPSAPSASTTASPSSARSAHRSPSASAVPAGPVQPATSGPSPAVGRSPSPAPPVPAGAIVGVAGRCAEVAGGNAADGTQVQLGGCNRSASQTWSLPGDGTARALGKCLDVRGGGTANRTPVQLFQCNATGAQQWRQRPDGTWLNPQSGRCLDAENGSSADGTRLIIWDCHGDANQRWRLA